MAPASRALWPEVTMVILACASFVPIIWVEAAGARWGDPLFSRLAAVDLVLVAVLAAELVIRYRRTEDKRQFWRESWYENPGPIRRGDIPHRSPCSLAYLWCDPG